MKVGLLGIILGDQQLPGYEQEGKKKGSER